MSLSPDDMVIDVCGLEPPEPLEKVLEALDRLDRGQRLRVIIGREPHPLYRILERNGFRHSAHSRDDGLYEILIWQQDAA